MSEQAGAHPQAALEAASTHTIAALALVSEWGHGEDCRYDDGETKCYCQREDLMQHLRAIGLALGQRTPHDTVLRQARAGVTELARMLADRDARELDRIRAAVVKALREASHRTAWLGQAVAARNLADDADAIENGADF